VARQRRRVLGSGIALGLSAALVVVGTVLMATAPPSRPGAGSDPPEWVSGEVMLPMGAVGIVVNVPLLAVSSWRHGKAVRAARAASGR
jgi:hypothetical protein